MCLISLPQGLWWMLEGLSVQLGVLVAAATCFCHTTVHPSETLDAWAWAQWVYRATIPTARAIPAGERGQVLLLRSKWLCLLVPGVSAAAGAWAQRSFGK